MTPTRAVDFYTWNRDFHGIRPRGTADERPVKLTPAVRCVALAIAAHINGKTRIAEVGMQKIAHAAQVSESVVSDAIPVLEAAGWLLVEHRKRRRTNVYRLASPVAAPADGSEHSRERGAVTPESGVTGVGHTPESGVSIPRRAGSNYVLLTNNPHTHAGARILASEGVPEARQKGADIGISAEGGAVEWKPDTMEVQLAAELGVDVDVAAAAFRQRMGERGWDRPDYSWTMQFEAYLREWGRQESSGRAESSVAAGQHQGTPRSPRYQAEQITEQYLARCCPNGLDEQFKRKITDVAQTALGNGYAASAVLGGLEEWHRSGITAPSQIPNFVVRVANPVPTYGAPLRDPKSGVIVER